MSAQSKQTLQLARQLFKLSLENGTVAPDRVTGVLAYLEKNRPAHPLAVLKAYRRLVATELSRSHAVVEHAGNITAPVLRALAAALGKKYQRPINATAFPRPDLIAGLRVRVGDDRYEASISGQLAALADAF